MAAPLCSTDYNNQYFTIYYHRSDAIVFSAGPMTYAFVASTLARLKSSGLTPIAVTSSGPNGNYTYAASGFSDYLKAFGGGNPWPSGFGGSPGGIIDDNGALYCTPPPSDSGGGPNCATGYYYDPESELCIPTPAPPGFPPGPIGGGGGGGGGGGNPPPPPPPLQCQVPGNFPMVNGACPLGYVPDPNDEGCCKPLLVGVPPPGGGGLPPPTGEPDPYGDEITQTLCAQMQANTLALISAIESAGSPAGGTPDPTCCANVVTAIGAVAFQLNAILVALPKLTGGAPLDLTQIVTELTAMAVSLNALATAPAMDLAPLTAAINDVARAIASAAPSDVKGIVDQLAKIFKTIDVPMSTYEWMAQQGWISKEHLQVLGTGDLGSGLVSVFYAALLEVTKFYQAIGGFVLGIPTDKLGPISETLPQAIARILSATLKTGSDPIYPVIKGMIDGVLIQLDPKFKPILGDVFVDTDAVLSKTLVPSVVFNTVALGAAYFGYNTSEELKKYVDIATEFVGLSEVKELLVGKKFAFGPERVADMQARSIFRQELQSASTLAAWHARGLIEPRLLPDYMAKNGVPDELEGAQTQAAYRGIPTFQMFRLASTGLFSDAEIADELTFSGMRPASQHRLIVAAAYTATDPERKQLRAAYEAEYREGLLGQVNLINLLDAADHNTDRNDLILRRVNSQILVDETKLLIAQYALLFKGGVYSDAQYRAQLAAIGLEQWKIDLEAGKAEAAANVATFKKNLAEAAAIERATVAEERKAAMQAFKSGTIPLAGLSAALVLTGLTPTQAAAWTSLAALQQAGSLRWIYGLLKSPPEAALLHGRVTALADQRKRLQIDDPAFTGALQAMGIPDRYINALRAATDALITPKTAAVTIPVGTG